MNERLRLPHTPTVDAIKEALEERLKETKVLSAASEDFVLLTGMSNPELASEVASLLGLDLDMPISLFADGEPHVQIKHNLRNRDVVILQSTSTPVAEHFMQLVLMVDAAKKASGKKVTAVLPYYGYGRQDRKDSPRVPISAATAARLLAEAGVDHIMTLDLHSEPTEGAFKGPWDNLPAIPALKPIIEDWELKNLVVVSPDEGGVKRANAYGRLMGSHGLAIIYKERDFTKENQSEVQAMVGKVGGKNCVIVDDMIDTGGSLIHAAEVLFGHGAASVRVAATHGIFSRDAITRLDSSPIEQIVVTDTIRPPKILKHSSKFQVVSVAPIIAQAILSNQTGESISESLYP
jgi:ribose-phosphate pyrophosphokinase